MRIKKRVAFIIPYFGNFQWYHNFFLHTCKYNLDFDFIFITDNPLEVESLSENIIIKKMTFIEVRNLVAQKLKLDISLNYPYKICDFRPAYGIIFSDILKSYDFWGHIDEDVILGNLKKFITQKVLEKNDIITLRHDYLVGCCTLYKNERKINLLFKKSKDYRKVFLNPYNLGFDETNFHFIEFAEGAHYSEVKSEYESMTHLVKRMSEKNYIKSFFEFCMIEDLPGRIKWHKGKVIYKNKYEAALYHMIQLKKVFTPKRYLKKIPDTFYISRNKLYY